MKNKNANNMMWVRYWIEKVAPSKELVEIYGHRLPNGKWRSEIDLPLINKVVKSTSITQVNAMKNVSDKAAKLIDEYIKNHPEYALPNTFKGKQWQFKENENGEFISAGLSEKAEELNRKQIKFIMDETLKAVQKAINRIKKINGSDKGLFIQVMDQTIFGKNATDKQITMKIWDNFQKIYNYEIMGINWARFGTNVIGIGYIFPDNQ